MLVAIGIVATAAWSSRTSLRSAEADIPGASVAPNAPGDIALTSATESETHPVYRYSIVPGGVHSPEDVSKAIADDAVVARHYEDVDATRLRVETLAVDRLAYVSYRKGDQVYWTKRPVLIPAGDTVLTDGQSTIRARCGNCLSTAPMLPTSQDEPETVAFDALVDTPPAAQIAGLLPSRNLTPGGASGPAGVAAGSFAGGVAGASGVGARGAVTGSGSVAGGLGSGGGGVATARSTPGTDASGPSSGGGGNRGPGEATDIELPGAPPVFTSQHEENQAPGDDNPSPGDDRPTFAQPRDTSDHESDDPKSDNPKSDNPKSDDPKSDNPKTDNPPNGGGDGGGGGKNDPPLNSSDVPGDVPTETNSLPEPMSLVLLGTGVSGFLLRRVAQRRQRRAVSERP